MYQTTHSVGCILWEQTATYRIKETHVHLVSFFFSLSLTTFCPTKGLKVFGVFLGVPNDAQKEHGLGVRSLRIENVCENTCPTAVTSSIKFTHTRAHTHFHNSFFIYEIASTTCTSPNKY